MNIGEVLSRAWEIIWKNKILWIFGLFAGLAGGSGGNNFRYNLQQNTNNVPMDLPAWAMGILFLLFLVLIVVFVILAALGRAGLVRGAWLADGGEPTLTFGQVFREGQAYFGRVLLMGILIVVMAVVLGLMLIVPSVLTCGLVAILIVPLFAILSIVVELAVVAMVGENLGIIESLTRAWQIARDNLALVIAVGLVVFIASSVVGFIVSLPMIAILAPVFISISANSGQISNGAWIISFFLALLYLPVLLAVQAVITSYVETTWTVAFRRLTGRAAGAAVTTTPQVTAAL